MARPRTPTNVLEMRGGLKNRPSRAKERENEPENKNAVGEPPKHLNKLEQTAFKEIVKLSIDGVLGEADKISIEMAACLLVKCRGQHMIDNEIVLATNQDQTLLLRYLSQFGMNPADRSKISITKKKQSNPFDD